MCVSSAGVKPQWPVESVPVGLVPLDEDLLELKRGNLLLEREKLQLEIQILRQKMAKMNSGDYV